MTARPQPPRRAGMLGQIGPAVIDQGLVSASNLLTIVLLARAVGPGELGRFVLVLAIGQLLVNVVGALVAQPLSVLGVAHDGDAFHDYVARSARLQLLLVAGTVTLLAAGAALTHAATGSHLAKLVLLAAPFIAMWQLQEFARRVLFAAERATAVLVNDLLAHGVRAGVLAALLLNDVLSVHTALVAGATTAAAGALLGMFQHAGLRRRSSWDLRELWRTHWTYGRWLVISDAMQVAAGRMYVFLTAALLATAATGKLAAVSQIANLHNVFMVALMSTLTPRFARVLATEGSDALLRQVRRWLVVMVAGSAVLLLPLVLLPQAALGLLYGSRYEDAGTLLQLQVGAVLLWVPVYVLSLALRVHRATWVMPLMFALDLTITIALGSMLLTQVGLEGSMIGSGLSAVACTTVLTVVYRRTRARFATHADAQVAGHSLAANDLGTTRSSLQVR